ncbi:MAG: hypothetical protein N3E38_03235 [Candidatus Aenigmarchaeota archaeon]|nr:hypothetical protein [Candidatus Aenigmarchaeota archaeon]
MLFKTKILFYIIFLLLLPIVSSKKTIEEKCIENLVNFIRNAKIEIPENFNYSFFINNSKFYEGNQPPLTFRIETGKIFYYYYSYYGNYSQTIVYLSSDEKYGFISCFFNTRINFAILNNLNTDDASKYYSYDVYSKLNGHGKNINFDLDEDFGVFVINQTYYDSLGGRKEKVLEIYSVSLVPKNSIFYEEHLENKFMKLKEYVIIKDKYINVETIKEERTKKYIFLVLLIAVLIILSIVLYHKFYIKKTEY